MAKYKKINLLLLVCSIIAAQSHITIYNQNKAFVQEQRTLKLDKKGKNLVQIDRIPKNADPGTILIQGDEIKVQFMKYTFNPVSTTSLLNAHIGTEIELVKYGDNGDITFSTRGELISNNSFPIFEIDGKIVVDPPYHYLFSEIPEGISENPYLMCQLDASTKNLDYHISYLTSDFDWEAEYSLILTPESPGKISGYYAITNNTQLEYKDIDISLVSGVVAFQNETPRGRQFQKRMTAMAYESHAEVTPEVSESGEYAVFHIPKKLTLSPDSEIRYTFIDGKQVKVDQVYHISHSLSHIRRNSPPHTTGVPVHTRFEFEAGAVGNFQLPAGSYKVYHQKKGKLTFLGSSRFGIAEKDTKIKLETGKAHKILAQFTVENFKLNKERGKAVVTAHFTNLKNENVTIEWIEQFRDGRWYIEKSDIEEETLDAFNVKFSVDIKANSTKEVTFTAIMDKD